MQHNLKTINNSHDLTTCARRCCHRDRCCCDDIFGYRFSHFFSSFRPVFIFVRLRKRNYDFTSEKKRSRFFFHSPLCSSRSIVNMLPKTQMFRFCCALRSFVHRAISTKTFAILLATFYELCRSATVLQLRRRVSSPLLSTGWCSTYNTQAMSISIAFTCDTIVRSVSARDRDRFE